MVLWFLTKSSKKRDIFEYILDCGTMVENLSDVIKEEIIECNFHLPFGEGVRKCEPTIFRAYKTGDNKIIMTIKEEDRHERIFCNYLKDEAEMDAFFDGISVEEHIMDNETFGTHYPYGANPRCDIVNISFSIYDDTIDREIRFFEGIWNLQYDDDGDEQLFEYASYSNRDELIESYIRTYMDDFLSVQTEVDMRNIIDESHTEKTDKIICNYGSEWNNREIAKNDIISMIKYNGYYPYILEDRKALTRILAICEHDKIPNIGIYSIVDIQHTSKKKWEWDQSQEYNISISGHFIDYFCEYCSGRKDSVICDVKIIPKIYKEETLDIQIRKANMFYDIKNGIQTTIDNAWGNVSNDVCGDTSDNTYGHSWDDSQIENQNQLQVVVPIDNIGVVQEHIQTVQLVQPIIDNSLNPDFLNEISSIHIFGSEHAIAKYPLDRKENVTFTIPQEILQEIINKIEESGKWRIVKANGTFHAVKNPEGDIIFDIPKDLKLYGKSIIFGETGQGKSTFLAYIGKLAVLGKQNVFTIESPRSLSIEHATHLDNNEKSVSTVLLCRPDLVLFDEVRSKRHFSQLKQLSLSCPNIVGSFHATDIFEAISRFSSLNGSRTYGEISTIVDKFIHIQKGEIVNWYTLNTTLSSKLHVEFHCDGVRPVTEIRDRNNNVVGWLFYFARDLNIVKNDKYRPNDKCRSNGKYISNENKKKDSYKESTRICDGESVKVFIDKNGSMYPRLWGRDISSITKT